MNKTVKLYGIIFSVVILLLAFFQLGKKEVVDWRKNFELKKKTPFGLYVFNKEADALLKNKIQRVSASPYDYYTKNSKEKPHNILVIQKHIDGESWKKILHQIEIGNDALVISNELNSNLEDTLRLNVSTVFYEDSSVYQLTDTKNPAELVMDRLPGNQGITYIDQKHEILGKLQIENKQLKANFVKINFGKGHLYYHTDPTVLTNYYLLKPNSEPYISGIFAYLKDQKTIWFVDSISENEEQSSSPLSFILKNPPLRYAWWLLLGGLLLFAIFGAKRKQRIIPVIEPLKNKSVEFVQSIGNLYLQEGDFHDMMAKKTQYFLNRIKTELLIDNVKLEDDFAQKLQQKTGKDREKINQAVGLMKKATDKYAQVTKEDFEKMNLLLDEIYPHNKI